MYAESEMQSLARRYVPACVVEALHLEPTAPWFLVKTKTDAERDLLKMTETLLGEFQAVFRARGCPEEIVRRLMFTFQSLVSCLRSSHLRPWSETMGATGIGP